MLTDKAKLCVMNGNLADLSPSERIEYYEDRCSVAGLDPATEPFQYITLGGKLKLYATKTCTDQLAAIRGASVEIISRNIENGCCVTTVRATNLSDGRYTEEIGAVDVQNLKGEAYSNAVMKSKTKATRRAVLTLYGLGMMDETEVDTIPGARIASVKEAHTGKLVITEEEASANAATKPEQKSPPAPRQAQPQKPAVPPQQYQKAATPATKKETAPVPQAQTVEKPASGTSTTKVPGSLDPNSPRAQLVDVAQKFGVDVSLLSKEERIAWFRKLLNLPTGPMPTGDDCITAVIQPLLAVAESMPKFDLEVIKSAVKARLDCETFDIFAFTGDDLMSLSEFIGSVREEGEE